MSFLDGYVHLALSGLCVKEIFRSGFTTATGDLFSTTQELHIFAICSCVNGLTRKSERCAIATFEGKGICTKDLIFAFYSP